MPAITGIGVTSAMGDGMRQCCAALRAGLTRVAQTERYLIKGKDPNADLEPLMAALAPAVPSDARAAERLHQLAFPAMTEAVESAGLARRELAEASFHLVLPGVSRPGYAGLAEQFPADFVRRAGLSPFAEVTVSRAGGSGVVEGVAAALQFLQRRPQAAAVVLAVDSLLDRETLGWLDARDRLKCSRNPEGVAVGEAAVALVIERTRTAEARRATLHATIDAHGAAREEATIFTDRPCTGTGLTLALRAAMVGLEAPPGTPWVLTDHNGERYRALELGYVINRCVEVFRELRHTWYAADGLGDTGAAAGGLLVARAVHAFARGYAPASQAMILTGSDDGARGVLVLGHPAPGRN